MLETLLEHYSLSSLSILLIIAILVIQIYGVPVSEELRWQMRAGKLSFESFGLGASALDVTRIEPQATESGHVLDMIGVVTTWKAILSPRATSPAA